MWRALDRFVELCRERGRGGNRAEIARGAEPLLLDVAPAEDLDRDDPDYNSDERKLIVREVRPEGKSPERKEREKRGWVRGGRTCGGSLQPTLRNVRGRRERATGFSPTRQPIEEVRSEPALGHLRQRRWGVGERFCRARLCRAGRFRWGGHGLRRSRGGLSGRWSGRRARGRLHIRRRLASDDVLR